MIKCDYRQPPWMTDSIENKQKKKCAKLTKKYFKGGKKDSNQCIIKWMHKVKVKSKSEVH